MHRLHLLRHAKASRDERYEEDHERPLAKRGRNAARLVGEELAKTIGAVDLVLCSSSTRTRETADLFLAAFKPRPKIQYEDELYLASAKVLLQRARRLEEGCGTVLMIGHNPGMHEFAVALAAGDDSRQHRDLANGKFPTTALASFSLDGTWAALDRGRSQLTDYVTPKSLDIED